MIHYRVCEEKDLDLMYEAFNKGFSDYIVKVDITKDRFKDIFLGIEQNDFKYSFIALDDAKPIGLMLGGIKDYEGVKTLRCGALCIDPKYRHMGIATNLFKFHKELAAKNNCQQLFLEVIKGNDKAINFYRKQGYQIIYDITYFKHGNPKEIVSFQNPMIEVKPITFNDAYFYYEHTEKHHMNWQSDFDFQKKLGNHVNYFGAFKDNKMIGVISLNKTGKIYYLHVLEQYRLNGVGTKLLNDITQRFNLDVLLINTTNNHMIINFLIKHHFEIQVINQYELYLPL